MNYREWTGLVRAAKTWAENAWAAADTLDGRRASGQEPSDGGGPAWHASPAAMTAYTAGRLDDLQAWSVEAHLTACTVCRAELAAAVHAKPLYTVRTEDVQHTLSAAAVVEEGRQRLLETLPALGGERARKRGTPILAERGHKPRWVVRLNPSPGPLLWQARWLVRPSAAAALVLAVSAAVVLALTTRLVPLGAGGGTGAVLWLLAPVLPLAGVALCSVRGDDAWGEAVLSTPAAGLKLLLWRTAAVLVLALPTAAAAGWTVDRTGTADARLWPILWLVPCLSLTTLTLALGTAFGVERAAAAVAASWALVIAGPTVVGAWGDGGTLRSALSALLASPSPADVPVMAGADAQIVWALLGIAAAVVVVRRRDAYEQLRGAA